MGQPVGIDCQNAEDFWVGWPSLGWAELAFPSGYSLIGPTGCLGNQKTATVDSLGRPGNGPHGAGCTNGGDGTGITIDCDIASQYRHGTSHDSYAAQGQDWAVLVSSMAEGNYLALHQNLYGGGPQMPLPISETGTPTDLVWVKNSASQLFVFVQYLPLQVCATYTGAPQLNVEPF
jgi:hypothetical protein